MASERSRVIWDAGVPLCDAWWHFAPEAIRVEFESSPDFLTAFEAVRPEGKSLLSILMPLVDALRTGVAASSNQRKFIEKMQEELLDDLYNSQLLATAYREAPTTSRSPIMIAADDFSDADADWENSKLIFHGKTFGRVRVTDPTQINRDLSKQKRIGRPGSGDAINKAINHLIQSDPEFCNLDRKVAAQKIRDVFNNSGIKGHGLSDPNLSKYLRKRCGLKLIP